MNRAEIDKSSLERLTFAQFGEFRVVLRKVDKACYNRIFVSRFNNGLWF